MVIIMIINFAAARIELPVVFNNSSARACDRDPGPSHRSGAEEFVVAVTANYMVLRSLFLPSFLPVPPAHDKRDGFGDRLCLECREGRRHGTRRK